MNVTATARAAAPMRAAALLAGGAAAVTLRSAVGGRSAAASTPAAIVFAAALLSLAVAAGWRAHRDRHWRRSLGLGAGGAALLVGMWLTAGVQPVFDARQHLGPLLAWTPVVVLVAVSEEIAVRGALFAAIEERAGAVTAVAVTSLAFGLAHVGLYGWAALPLDITVGLLLGGLRLLTGGVTAPATAHAIADLAGGWLS